MRTPLIAIGLCLLFAIPLSAQSGRAYIKSIEKHRQHYKKEFLREERSPLDKKGIKKLAFFPVEEAYRVSCTFEPTPHAEPFDMATYSGITKPYVKYGTATFVLNGQTCQLAIYQSLQLRQLPMYRDYLFIPFKDPTNGETTYGGGRYMDIRAGEIQNGRLTLDFNKAYNPYCAYSDGYNCPVPPTENHLNLPIEAGEMVWGGH
ncbi:MAG: DUF1684 domain-containing protein [Phaeodactylibacter sp.]|nr:DUF1684 domain-containing protein [Phaeodactylibacter sp.]MCB9301546.1 DUF1684 domain-containing protein [Lewinellaceae bacterium]